MELNVGGIDKSVRIVLGILLLLVGIFAEIGLGVKIGVFVIAAIALGTGFFGL